VNRVLLDQWLAPLAASILRQRGFDAVHVSEFGMERVEDTAIPDRAASEPRVGHVEARVAYRSIAPLQNVDAEGQAALIQTVYAHSASVLSECATVSADRSSIRVRRLPLR
jgi:hypothetical protein